MSKEPTHLPPLPPLRFHHRHDSAFQQALQEKREKLEYLEARANAIFEKHPPEQRLTPLGWWPQVMSFGVLYVMGFGLSTWLGIHNNTRLRPVKWWKWKKIPENEELKPLAPNWLVRNPELPVLGYVGAILLNALGNAIQSYENREVNKLYSESLQQRMWWLDRGNEFAVAGAVGMGLFISWRKKIHSETWSAVNQWTKRQGDNIISLAGWVIQRFFNGEIARERNAESRAQWEERDRQLQDCYQESRRIISELIEAAAIAGEENRHLHKESRYLHKENIQLIKKVGSEQEMLLLLEDWNAMVRVSGERPSTWAEHISRERCMLDVLERLIQK